MSKRSKSKLDALVEKARGAVEEAGSTGDDTGDVPVRFGRCPHCSLPLLAPIDSGMAPQHPRPNPHKLSQGEPEEGPDSEDEPPEDGGESELDSEEGDGRRQFSSASVEPS